MIRSKNIDAEAGRWSEPMKLASSTTASFAWKNPTGKEVLITNVIVNVTTAAASKTVSAGVSATATATTATNEILDAATLTTGQTIISPNPTTVAKGSYIVGTLSATDATLDAYAYVQYKELTK